MSSSFFLTRQILLPILLISFVLCLPAYSQLFEWPPLHPSGSLEQSDSAFNLLQPTAAVQRVPESAFERVPNTVSNVEMNISNYGTFGFDSNPMRGAMWPRGSDHRYLKGGGLWFGAQKLFRYANGTDMRKMSLISYNPNTGDSWMVPGTIDDPYGEADVNQDWKSVNNFRLYRSTDYDPITGRSIDSIDAARGGFNWPIWDTNPLRTLREEHYFGNYVQLPQGRYRSRYPKGPAILSDEDIVAIYRDTDLSYNELGEEAARAEGYPLGIQFEQTVYSWGFGVYKDILIIRYRIINCSPDTLYYCWVAPAIDLELGHGFNDHVKSAIPESDRDKDTLNLGVAWSEREEKEYGYFGCDILESPAVDNYGFVRKDKNVYTDREQLGLKTFVNWVVNIDPRTPEERYEFMARGTLDGDNGGGDKRFLAAAGPFNMFPGDTAHFAIGLLFALPVGPYPTGNWEDMEHLINLDRFAQMVYDGMRPTSAVEDRNDGSWLWKSLDLR